MTVPASGVRAGPPEPLAGGGTPRERSAPPTGAVPAAAGRPAPLAGGRCLGGGTPHARAARVLAVGGRAGRVVDGGAPPVPPADGDAPLEHRLLDGGGHGPVRAHRHHGGLGGGADGPARSSHVGRASGPARRDSRLRRRLRLGVARSVAARLRRRGAGDDLRGVPPRLSARGGEPAQRRPRAGGGGAQLGGRARPHVLADHRGAGPAGHPRRVPPRRARAPRRVRRVRDPRLPDLHDRDLLGVRGGVQRTSGLPRSHSCSSP